MATSTYMPVAAPHADWTLTECREHDSTGCINRIAGSPFTLGRQSSTSLPISSPTVSKLHAELIIRGDELWVRDLGSTNGTFVNGRRIGETTPLAPGDLLQLASVVFRVGRQRTSNPMLTIQESSGEWAQLLCQFDQLMNLRAAAAHFQPLVELATRRIIGFEALARSTLSGLETPRQMFAVAEKFDEQCALSEWMRLEAVSAAAPLPSTCALFLNTHPSEVGRPSLADSLRELRGRFPTQSLVIEIHEAAATNLQELLELRALLRQLNIKLAFDDFGAGQARLRELTEVAPDYVKFDMHLIRGIDGADERRRATLSALVQMVSNLGIVTLAEGIETAGEARACVELGFLLAQGYFFGRPAPVATLLSAGAGPR